MKDIVLFWIQCSGKGTQAKLITKNNPDMYSYFSSGDHFRALQTTENAIGDYLKARMEKGDLIDDNVTNSLFLTYFHTVLDDQKHMLLDGYPRTVNQLDDIFKITDSHKREMLWIHFTLPDEIVFERMKSRWRSDDTPEAMQHRIAQFYEKTVPVIDYFWQHAEMITVDATRSIDQIAQDVQKIIAS